ncbi:MAG: SPFH domain-containing protein [Planctomycetaceae bacterium]|nr:SPFH domain-containing protein [Planctomycetaceae bacterium]
MSLFSKNPNESAYPGGKKHWADVIKNEGSSDLLLWRHPAEDFNTNSTLIVEQGFEAIFIKDGLPEAIFESGKHVLSTENYPILSRLRTMFTGGVSTFNCVVYFISTFPEGLQINWGTKSPITIWDNMIAQNIELRSFGSYNVKVADPGVFFSALGLSAKKSFSRDELQDIFSGRFQKEIVTCISDTLEAKRNNGEMLFQVVSKYREFSEAVAPYFEKILEKSGIELIDFSIESLKPDAEAQAAFNQLMRDTQWGIAKKQAEAVGDKKRMDILGDDWGRQQAANILGTLAENPGSGGMAATGAGFGMGMAAGGVFGNMAQQMFSPMQQPPTPAALPQPSGRFTQKSADAAHGDVRPPDDPVATLKKLKEMLELGLIEQTEFDTKKAEIMSRM